MALGRAAGTNMLQKVFAVSEPGNLGIPQKPIGILGGGGLTILVPYTWTYTLDPGTGFRALWLEERLQAPLTQ